MGIEMVNERDKRSDAQWCGLSDAALLEAYKLSPLSVPAFDELWRRYRDVVRGTVGGHYYPELGDFGYEENRECARENFVGGCESEAYAKARRCIHQVADATRLPGWFATVARRVVIDRLRAYVRRKPRELPLPKPAAGEDDGPRTRVGEPSGCLGGDLAGRLEKDKAATLLAPLLRAMRNGTTGQQQQVRGLWLVYGDDLSIEDAAAVLALEYGFSRETGKRRIREGRTTLRALLESSHGEACIDSWLRLARGSRLSPEAGRGELLEKAFMALTVENKQWAVGTLRQWLKADDPPEDRETDGPTRAALGALKGVLKGPDFIQEIMKDILLVGE